MIKDGVGIDWAGNIISFGALVAITSVVLTILYGQTRIMFAMCRDGLMPRSFAKVNDKTRTPIRITATFGVLIAVVAAFVPLKEIVKLVNIGTLFAFIVVNIGVIILRRTQARPRARLPRPVRAGLPDHRVAAVRLPDAYLSLETWLRFVGWMAFGLVIYFTYGIRHSRLRQGEVVNPEAELPDAT